MLQRLVEDMKQAMKAGDKVRLSTIRMLRAAIKDREIELGYPLNEEEAVAVFNRLVKQRREAAKQYAEAGRDDLAEAELAELAVIEGYLPEQLSDAELEALVDSVIAETGAASMRDMGRVMAALKARAAGRADMGKLSGMVKSRLS